MTDTLLPLPKYIIESGGYTALPSVISSEPEFVKAGKAFAAYIKEDFGANMVKGTDGTVRRGGGAGLLYTQTFQSDYAQFSSS